MFEKRSPTKGMPLQTLTCSAIVSVITLDNAYVDSGCGKWSSSTGA